SAGELVLFDRSWYNRAGVEPIMGFCTPAQHKQFLKDCPVFERLITKDGLILLNTGSASTRKNRKHASPNGPTIPPSDGSFHRSTSRCARNTSPTASSATSC